ncbi:hypothetical protein CROQUDRAFT_653249 [Cronartium quercuum f. sp. fusiforme G11]|uniref:Cyclin-like domain-containing protein n=1 Tax=Cronartium quercuum f. sp. fusiforme G11 TaxID=708437 RepID=A0A9P6TFF7_9BASI|nr:hypothetical protein CROQUDRAFT_653249 [Cronartium quercuum f. sp. fusiforme G11]
MNSNSNSYPSHHPYNHRIEYYSRLQHSNYQTRQDYLIESQSNKPTYPNTSHQSCNPSTQEQFSLDNEGRMLPPQPPSYASNGAYPTSTRVSTYKPNPPLDHSQFPPPPPPPPQPPQACSVIKTYRPYFSLVEVEQMVRIQSGKIPPARIESTRQQACIFMDKVGTRLGFPRRTIASAQLLYHRFHLFFPFGSFNPHDVSISALMLASKMEDTLKKLREIQMTAWVVRNIQDGGSGQSEPEPATIEAEKGKLVGIERLLLETVCFDFGSGRLAGGKDLFGYVVAIGRHLKASTTLIHLGFRLAVDSYRTLVALTYPPHVIALACLYLASFFDSDHPNYSFSSSSTNVEGVEPRFEPGWIDPFEADQVDIEDICHAILDLFISLAPPLKSHQSPTSPSDAQPRRVASLGTAPASVAPCPSTSELTKLKIALRARSNERMEADDDMGDMNQPGTKRPKLLAGLKSQPDSQDSQLEGTQVLGRDDVTVRFIFGGSGL